jgi:hypothetical protein
MPGEAGGLGLLGLRRLHLDVAPLFDVGIMLRLYACSELSDHSSPVGKLRWPRPPLFSIALVVITFITSRGARDRFDSSRSNQLTCHCAGPWYGLHAHRRKILLPRGAMLWSESRKPGKNGAPIGLPKLYGLRRSVVDPMKIR